VIAMMQKKYQEKRMKELYGLTEDVPNLFA
jgi:hypothetical protein